MCNHWEVIKIFTNSPRDHGMDLEPVSSRFVAMRAVCLCWQPALSSVSLPPHVLSRNSNPLTPNAWLRTHPVSMWLSEHYSWSSQPYPLLSSLYYFCRHSLALRLVISHKWLWLDDLLKVNSRTTCANLTALRTFSMSYKLMIPHQSVIQNVIRAFHLKHKPPKYS